MRTPFVLLALCLVFLSVVISYAPVDAAFTTTTTSTTDDDGTVEYDYDDDDENTSLKDRTDRVTHPYISDEGNIIMLKTSGAPSTHTQLAAPAMVMLGACFLVFVF